MSILKYAILVPILVFALPGASVAVELSYGTFLGGSGSDSVARIDCSEGRYVVGGFTSSPDFPMVFTGYQSGPAPDSFSGDGFIAIFDSENQLEHSTLFSGNLSEYLRDILVLPDGIVTVWDTESTDLGDFYPNAPPSNAGSLNVMIVKYSSDLKTVEWGYSLAGNDWDFAATLAAGAGKIVCVGRTYSTDLPSENSPPYDDGGGYILVLDAQTGAMIHLRYFYHGDITGAVVLDDGSILISGFFWWSEAPPVSQDAADTTVAGEFESYVAKCDENLSVEWLTYLGGNYDESAAELRWHEPSRSIIAVIATNSTDMPVFDTYWPNNYVGSRDIYLCALDEFGREFQWGGYLGGSEWDITPQLLLDDSGHMVVGIETLSLDLPVGDQVLEPRPSEGMRNHGYVAAISLENRTMSSATYFPGNGHHEIYDLGLLDQEIITVGYIRPSLSPDIFTPTPDAYDSTVVGFSEGSILRISDENIVGIEAPPFTTSVSGPRVVISWPDDGRTYQAEIVRGTSVQTLSVLHRGGDCIAEDLLTNVETQMRSLYRIRDLDDPTTVLYEYVLDPAPRTGVVTVSVTTQGSELILRSPDFTADRTEIAIYDLRGRRILLTESALSFQDEQPIHVLPLAELSRFPNGAYLVKAEFGGRHATGKLLLNR